jgi:precorrin-3B synthase
VHEAADGGLARVRLPGGVLSASQLRVLARAAVELGDGHLELTSRANVQIRALQPGAPVELSERLYAARLLPSISHERVRNILASPLSGLDEHSQYDVLPLAAELDRLLCATPVLAGLPGRFLFALDDGRGDLASSKADVAVRMVDSTHGELVLAGVRTGVLLDAGRVAEVMVAAAEAFLVERAAQGSEAWRLAELADGPRAVRMRLGLEAAAEVPPAVSCPTPAAGPFGRGVVATVPLGVLGAEQAEVLADAADEVRVTPWRSVVVVGEPAVSQLAAVGLVVEETSPWNGVTSCAGRPGCAKALADVRGDARRVVPGWSAGRKAVHWSGCERRCGKPGGEFVDVVALPGGGYAVDGVAMGVDKVRAQ